MEESGDQIIQSEFVGFYFIGFGFCLIEISIHTVYMQQSQESSWQTIKKFKKQMFAWNGYMKVSYAHAVLSAHSNPKKQVITQCISAMSAQL